MLGHNQQMPANARDCAAHHIAQPVRMLTCR